MMFANNAWVALSKVGNATNLVSFSGTVATGQQTIIGSHSTKV